MLLHFYFYIFAMSCNSCNSSRSDCCTFMFVVIGSSPGFVTVISMIVPSVMPVENTAFRNDGGFVPKIYEIYFYKFGGKGVSVCCEWQIPRHLRKAPEICIHSILLNTLFNFVFVRFRRTAYLPVHRTDRYPDIHRMQWILPYHFLLPPV